LIEQYAWTTGVVKFNSTRRIVVTEIILTFVSAGLEEIGSEKLHTVQTRALRLVELSAHNGVSFYSNNISVRADYLQATFSYRPSSHLRR
jgi:hypothetical protein